MKYADVILPLPLDGLFTYSVPVQMEVSVRFGVRVLVPFGRSKSYVGVVARVHDCEPQGYKVKPVTRMMDAGPVVTHASTNCGSG